MNVSANEYQNHSVFSELSDYIEFYNHLSHSVLHFITQGTQGIINIDTYAFSSMEGTLNSIKLVLQNGRINDAWALLRKYYDSIAINIYTNMYLKDNFTIENFVVTQINNWIKNTSKLPKFVDMATYIKEHSEYRDLSKLFDYEGRYASIRKRCDDHMHYNYFAYVIFNDNMVFIKNRLNLLKIFQDDLCDLFIFHISYLFILNEYYMASSDYVDYLDCGMLPPEDSQQWVAPFVQDIIDKIDERQPNITNFIRGATTMHLK